MKNNLKKIIIALLVTSSLKAGTDFNVLADGIDYLISHTKSLESRLIRSESSIEKLRKENKKLKKAGLAIKNKNINLEDKINFLEVHVIKKININIKENSELLIKLEKKHDKDIKKLNFDSNGIISIDETIKCDQSNVLLTESSSKQIQSIEVKHDSDKIKRIKEQQKRLKSYIDGRKKTETPTTK